jgi:hypothetical protein
MLSILEDYLEWMDVQGFELFKDMLSYLNATEIDAQYLFTVDYCLHAPFALAWHIHV